MSSAPKAWRMNKEVLNPCHPEKGAFTKLYRRQQANQQSALPGFINYKRIEADRSNGHKEKLPKIRNHPEKNNGQLKLPLPQTRFI